MRIIESALSILSQFGLDPETLHRFIAELATGGQDKVFRTGTSPWGLAASATGALEITITTGLYVVSEMPVFVKDAQVITFPGSSGNTYTLQGNLGGTITKVIGTSPDADNIKLYQVLDDDGDISDDITDVREFA